MWQAKETMTLARCQAAWHLVPSAIALTHEAAAAVLGLATTRHEPDIRVAVAGNQTRGTLILPSFQFTQGNRQLPGREVALRRSSLCPDPEEVIVVHGMSVTSPLRTALDCAFDLPVRQSLPIIDSALRAVCRPDRRSRRSTAVISIDEARRMLKAMSEQHRGRRGARRARTAIALADPLAESPGESVLRWAVAAAGLPPPVLQRPVVVEGHEYFLDLGLEEVQRGWEFDGLAKSQRPEDLRREKLREMRIARTGWHIDRFVWEEIFQPRSLVRRVTRLYPQAVRRDDILPELWR